MSIPDFGPDKGSVKSTSNKMEREESSFERRLAESMGEVESMHAIVEDREEDMLRLQKS
jgi:hypothetical protein